MSIRAFFSCFSGNSSPEREPKAIKVKVVKTPHPNVPKAEHSDNLPEHIIHIPRSETSDDDYIVGLAIQSLSFDSTDHFSNQLSPYGNLGSRNRRY